MSEQRHSGCFYVFIICAAFSCLLIAYDDRVMKIGFQLNEQVKSILVLKPLRPPLMSINNSELDRYKNANDIIFFTTFINAPGRFEIQKLVVKNWSQFYPKVKCVLFVNFTERALHEDFEELIKFSVKHNWLVFPILEVNSYGTPFLLPMIKFVITTFKATLYGYINGDNIFDNGLISSLEAVESYLPRLNFTVMVVGVRANIEYRNSSNFRNLWESDEVVKAAKNDTGPRWPDAMEYFFLTRSFPVNDLKNVVIGRPGVDNYLMLRAIQLGVATIDFSATVTDVHFHPSTGRIQGWQANDGEYNKQLLGPVPWGQGATYFSHMQTVKNGNGTIILLCRKSPALSIDKCLKS